MGREDFLLSALHVVQAFQVVKHSALPFVFDFWLAGYALGEGSHLRSALGLVEVVILETRKRGHHLHDTFGAGAREPFDDAAFRELGTSPGDAHDDKRGAG
eukprot:GFKZ01006266.1.p3 GENE.GFKZ01006266.1~~GFKZ01006266.1.p3  ORF type:complete len:101 (-),score=8.24 GFKZ01006266.1:31-333(-)